MGSGQFDKAGILAADFSGLEAQSPGFTVCHWSLDLECGVS